MKTKVIASSLLIACIVSGCENPKQSLGTLGGGALGGWAGSTIGKGRGQVVATAVGAVLGAFAGGYIGGQLDQKDRMEAAAASQQALETAPSGQSVAWRNPDSGHSGTIRPLKTYKEPSGQHCREFQQTITIGGKTERAYGTACRQADGAWQIVS